MKILGSPVFIVIFALVFIIFLYRYWNLLNTLSLFYRTLLFSLRLFTVISLLILLINPWFNYKRKEEVPQKIDIIFDHSESMMNHYEQASLEFNKILLTIEEWGRANQVDFNIYRLGNNIYPLENIDVFDLSTDFSHLGKFMEFENSNQLLLITDGKATIGRELSDLNLPDGIPIHVLGVGPVKKLSDLIIKNVDIPQRSMEGDIINIIVRLGTY